jgi:hypothetical protein
MGRGNAAALSACVLDIHSTGSRHLRHEQYDAALAQHHTELVRSMHCYCSNLIEWRNTHLEISIAAWLRTIRNESEPFNKLSERRGLELL